LHCIQIINNASNFQKWAVKIFDNPKVTIEAVKREANWMFVLNHENIIRIFGVATNGGKLCIMLEYAENGSLEKFMYPKS
jgi:serine/threonine protein kinase